MKILQLRAINPGLEEVVVNIDRPTHIGRAKSNGSTTPTDYQEATGRPLPKDFHDAEICFQLDSPTVSRNHALIRRHPKRAGLFQSLFTEKEEYEIVDLNSKNGVRVNGKKEDKCVLNPSDRLKIGNIEFKVSYTESSGKNYALLVGSDGGNLRGVSADIAAMQQFWGQRKGFTLENISTLVNGSATYDKVFTRLEDAKRTCSDESLFIFYFSGHGKKGVYLSDKKINPETLYAHMDHIRGKKLIIIDACHAGDFAETEKLPEKTLLMLASQKDQKAHEEYHGTLMNPDYIGNFTRALLKILDKQPHEINLKQVERELGDDFRLYARGQSPKVTGYTIFCPSIKTGL
ncbi:MAG: FHA domain-containing protein [Candidatus Woesearchaeota archaeon]